MLEFPGSAEDFERGVELFNRGRYFEAHDAWEQLWLGEAKDTPPKLFIQGLIMVAGALDQCKKGEYSGAVKLLEKGVKRLTEYRSIGSGVMDVEDFLGKIEPLYERLIAGAVSEPPLGNSPPAIRLSRGR
jgi:predicted metal-dependent hydrolase